MKLTTSFIPQARRGVADDVVSSPLGQERLTVQSSEVVDEQSKRNWNVNAGRYYFPICSVNE